MAMRIPPRHPARTPRQFWAEVPQNIKNHLASVAIFLGIWAALILLPVFLPSRY